MKTTQWEKLTVADWGLNYVTLITYPTLVCWSFLLMINVTGSLALMLMFINAGNSKIWGGILRARLWSWRQLKGNWGLEMWRLHKFVNCNKKTWGAIQLACLLSLQPQFSALLKTDLLLRDSHYMHLWRKILIDSLFSILKSGSEELMRPHKAMPPPPR